MEALQQEIEAKEVEGNYLRDVFGAIDSQQLKSIFCPFDLQSCQPELDWCCNSFEAM